MFKYILRIPVWVMAAVLSVAGTCMMVGSYQVEGDTIWHLKVGEWVLANHTVPKADPFSWTAQGAEWHAHEWLWEVLAYLAYSAWGKYGVWALTCLGVALWGTSLFLLARRAGTWGVVLAAFALLSVSPFWGARPHPLAQGLWALWAALLALAVPKISPARAFTAGLALHALWANLHGSVPFGVATALLFAVAVRGLRKVYVPALAGAAAGACCNPWGPLIFEHAALLSGNPLALANVGEWLSPDFHEPGFLLCFLALAGAALSGCFLLAFRGRKIPLVPALLAAATFSMGLVSVRHLVYFYFSAAWLAAEAFALEKPKTPAFVSKALATSCVAALLATGAFCWPPTWTEKMRERVPFPEEAVAFMKEAGLTERIFNYYPWGGYLIAEGLEPFIDGRGDMYILSGSGVFESYLDAFGRRRGMRAVPADPFGVMDWWGVEVVLLPPGTLPALALEGRGWNIVYRDDVAVVLVKSVKGVGAQ